MKIRAGKLRTVQSLLSVVGVWEGLWTPLTLCMIRELVHSHEPNRSFELVQASFVGYIMLQSKYPTENYDPENHW